MNAPLDREGNLRYNEDGSHLVLLLSRQRLPDRQSGRRCHFPKDCSILSLTGLAFCGILVKKITS